MTTAAPPAAGRAPRWSLTGRRAIVTGAGRGLGRGIAVALADAGADVVLLSRTRTELCDVAAEITAGGGTCEWRVCDVTDRNAVRVALEGLGEIDVLVNSAGTNVPEAFLAVDERSYDTVFTVNVRGTFFVTQAVAQAMVDAGHGGSIINLSSQMGHVGASGRTVYCASKHAIEGLTKAMAVELAPHAVRVNAVAPTFVDTPMTRPFLADEAFLADVERRIPLGRIGTVDDVVGGVLYLASPAAGLVTGTSLLIDGGYTAH